MGKGKKERSKKNKNKKETREPIKRKYEGKKYCVPTHTLYTPDRGHKGTPRSINGDFGCTAKDIQLYEKMFSGDREN